MLSHTGLEKNEEGKPKDCDLPVWLNMLSFLAKNLLTLWILLWHLLFSFLIFF